MHVPFGCIPGLQVMALSVLKDLKRDTSTTYTFCMGTNSDVFEICLQEYATKLQT
jgi:hypothetical protein